MIRPSTLFWGLLVAASGYAMFQVKYEVAQLEDELGRVNRQIGNGREAIRVLNAEWSYLNQPSRLDQLAKRYLNLGPIQTSQIGRLLLGASGPSELHKLHENLVNTLGLVDDCLQGPLPGGIFFATEQILRLSGNDS